MVQVIRRWLAVTAAALALVWVSVSQAEELSWEAGKHYQVLPYPVRTQDPNKVEVVELFWYGCPHCYQFRPLLEAWEKTLAEDVQMVLLPAVLGSNWEPAARAYYAVEALGQLDKFHGPFFNAMVPERKPMKDEDSIAAFVATLGINEADFRKAYNSFAVKAKLDSGDARVRGYRATGVPALVINGKYRVSASEAGSHEAMLKVADYLIAQERAARKAQ